MAAKEKHSLPRGAVIAGGKGQCGTCFFPIEIGEAFWWRGQRSECSRCRNKRLKQAKLDRDAGKG